MVFFFVLGNPPTFIDRLLAHRGRFSCWSATIMLTAGDPDDDDSGAPGVVSFLSLLGSDVSYRSLKRVLKILRKSHPAYPRRIDRSHHLTETPVGNLPPAGARTPTPPPVSVPASDSAPLQSSHGAQTLPKRSRGAIFKRVGLATKCEHALATQHTKKAFASKQVKHTPLQVASSDCTLKENLIPKSM